LGGEPLAVGRAVDEHRERAAGRGTPDVRAQHDAVAHGHGDVVLEDGGRGHLGRRLVARDARRRRRGRLWRLRLRRRFVARDARSYRGIGGRLRRFRRRAARGQGEECKRSDAESGVGIHAGNAISWNVGRHDRVAFIILGSGCDPGDTMRSNTALLAQALCLTLGTAATAHAADYTYYVTGDPRDVVTPTRGLVVLQGGGDDVDENYVRMGRLGGGGDFVVLRASGAD